jgi:hypothetical protein
MKLSTVTLFVSLVASVSALHIPFKRRSTGTAPIRSRQRRDASQPSPDDSYNFKNLENLLYVATIFVDGQPFEVGRFFSFDYSTQPLTSSFRDVT